MMDFKERLREQSEVCIDYCFPLRVEDTKKIVALLDAVDEEIMVEVGKKMFPQTAKARNELGGGDA
jgi:hypothetical protein